MTIGIDEVQRKAIRVAGFLCLLMAFTAPIGILYVPSKLIIPGDATATADHIRASESLIRIGIGSELIYPVIAVFLVLPSTAYSNLSTRTMPSCWWSWVP